MRYKIYPKKKFSQYFLMDKYFSKKITDSISYNKNITIVEIGPGIGALSSNILKKCYNDFFLIEIDRDLVIFLKKKYPLLENKIIECDFLKWNPDNFGLSSFILIGNFPYNISSKILLKIFYLNKYITECICMFQKELVDKLFFFKKKNKVISILIKAFYKIEYLFTVKDKNIFYPKTNVESCVIRLIRIKKNYNFDYILFFKIVTTAFNQKRKILKNSLKKFKNIKFKDNNIMNKHAEQVSINDFIKITNENKFI